MRRVLFAVAVNPVEESRKGEKEPTANRFASRPESANSTEERCFFGHPPVHKQAMPNGVDVESTQQGMMMAPSDDANIVCGDKQRENGYLVCEEDRRRCVQS